MKFSPVLGANQVQGISVTLAGKTKEPEVGRKVAGSIQASNEVARSLESAGLAQLRMGAAARVGDDRSNGKATRRVDH